VAGAWCRGSDLGESKSCSILWGNGALLCLSDMSFVDFDGSTGVKTLKISRSHLRSSLVLLCYGVGVRARKYVLLSASRCWIVEILLSKHSFCMEICTFCEQNIPIFRSLLRCSCELLSYFAGRCAEKARVPDHEYGKQCLLESVFQLLLESCTLFKLKSRNIPAHAFCARV